VEDKLKSTIEVRGFLQLDAFLRKSYGKPPYMLKLTEPTTGEALAKQLNIALSEIEVIFVNGFVQDLNYIINPGDRVALLPPGCPGPYRLALGFYAKNQGNEANFKIQGR